MSILNVNKINPVGGGSTITIAGIASVTSNVSVSGSIVAGTTITGEHHGDGSNLTGISVDSTKIETGNTKVETIDTGSDGHVKITTEGGERIRIQSDGDVGIGTIDNTNNERLRVQDDASTSTSCQLSIISGSAERSILNFGDKEDPNIGRVSYHNNTNTLSIFTNNTERFLINSDGYRTIPNQPNFLTLTETSTLSANNYNYIVVSATHINVGSCYNGSNGRFTAPIDGYYFFYGMYTGENNISAPVMGFHKNGGSHQGEALNYNATYDGTSMQQVKQLSAGDYVNWSIRDWNNQAPNPWHTWWGGYLLY